jgi:cytochrome c peroxidase
MFPSRQIYSFILLLLVACQPAAENLDSEIIDPENTELQEPVEEVEEIEETLVPPVDEPVVEQVILDLPAQLYNYANPELPAHFEVETLGFHGQLPLVDTDNTPNHNPTTDAGATLGRVLFYDTNLSKNGTIACASCHVQEFGFSDDRPLSEGFEGGETGRHSMGLTNARFYSAGHFFWDQRAETLEDQVLMPFQDPVEMGMTLETLVEAAQAQDYYPELFMAAFSETTINSHRISLALAQFVRSLVSYRSKYDEGRAQVAGRDYNFPNFTEEENFGKALFVLPPPYGGFACFVCHQGEGFIPQEATNNGLDPDSTIDAGYGEVTGYASHMGKFKVPSLRNVAVRAPYMHDGRFDSLDEVINHYSRFIQPHPNLGAPFGVFNGEATKLHMSFEEKSALIAFLKTLTDYEMLDDPKFSDPFVRDQD